MLALLACASLLGAPSPADRVVVVSNLESPTSVEIAADYIKRRGIRQRVQVRCPDSALDAAKETLPYAEYLTAIRTPLANYLARHPEVDFIVLTKGIPIRLTGAPTGLGAGQPSLDSTLAAWGYEERTDVVPVNFSDSGFTGKAWANRFWNSGERFSHAKFGGYLVTRLDGYTVEEAKALTTYSLLAEKEPPTGRILIDTVLAHGITDVAKHPLSPVKDGKMDPKTINEMAYNEYDTDMVNAGMQLGARNLPVVVDRTDEFVGRKGDLMGYCSWGSNDPKFVAAGYAALRFAPGGIAETAVSTSARTFLPTTGGQSLIADLIRGRATGVKGYCDEPLLQAVASPTVLFDRYTRGWTLAESFYAASRFVGWEDIVVGDPLCTPYRPK